MSWSIFIWLRSRRLFR